MDRRCHAGYDRRPGGHHPQNGSLASETRDDKFRSDPRTALKRHFTAALVFNQEKQKIDFDFAAILRAFFVGNAGRAVWNTMKQNIIDSFGVAPDSGGTLFLTELGALWRSGKKPRITIIGMAKNGWRCPDDRFRKEIVEQQKRMTEGDLRKRLSSPYVLWIRQKG